MYYKNYGITGELEKMYNCPVNINVSLEENKRIIKLYRAFLLRDENVMFECAGKIPKQKLKHTKILKKYINKKTIITTAALIAILSLLLVLTLNKTARTVLIVIALAFPIVYTTVVLVYWHLIDNSPDLEAVGRIKYLITDKRIIARHGQDVNITNIEDILYVLPEKRGKNIGNVIFATDEPDFPVIFGGAYQHSGIYMTRDFSTAFEIIRTLLMDRDRRNEFITENSHGYDKMSSAAKPDKKFQRTVITDYGKGFNDQKVNNEMDELELPDQLTLDAMLGNNDGDK